MPIGELQPNIEWRKTVHGYAIHDYLQTLRKRLSRKV